MSARSVTLIIALLCAWRPAAARAEAPVRASDLTLDAELVAGLAMNLPFSPAEKQALLEAPDRSDRQDVLTALLEIDSLSDDDGPPETLQ